MPENGWFSVSRISFLSLSLSWNTRANTVADSRNAKRRYCTEIEEDRNYGLNERERKKREKRLRFDDGQQKQKMWYPSGLSPDQQNKGTRRRKWTKGAASLIPLLHVTENARPSGIMPRFPATAGRTVALAIRDFILWGVSPLCSTIILPAVYVHASLVH